MSICRRRRQPRCEKRSETRIGGSWRARSARIVSGWELIPSMTSFEAIRGMLPRRRVGRSDAGSGGVRRKIDSNKAIENVNLLIDLPLLDRPLRL